MTKVPGSAPSRTAPVAGGQPLERVSGLVTLGGTPVADAVVRVQTTGKSTRTDGAGRFTLSGLPRTSNLAITAWTPGAYIAGVKEVPADGSQVSIDLKAHGTEDNAAYKWMSAYAAAGDKANCQNCHSLPDDPSTALPFDEWVRDAHSRSTSNQRFLTMYAGTDVDGNQSAFARFGESRRFSGTAPLVPEQDEPYYGSGFRLDYPYVAGSCSACHAPSAQFTASYGADPTLVTGTGKEGTTCDLCHKIWDVRLEPVTGLPNRDAPGILSYEFRRPAEGHQFFAGPFDDVAPGEDTYLPLQTKSEYCAGCHYGVFWDTTVYNSFGEWKDSPYSDPVTGRTCQGCHMPRGLTTYIADPAKGGLVRHSATIGSHKMLGIADESFMRSAATVDARARRESAGVVVEVDITNDKTGHHIPTDSPLRQLILLVQATDADGRPLKQTDGPTLPEWAGVGKPTDGFYAGLPGTAYAKVLQEFRSSLAPTAAYWNPTRILSDNRIPALATDATRYVFAAPAEGVVSVDVTLLFRRAYIGLATQKGWSDPDLVMHQETVLVEGGE